jgi:hypothetical protein
LMGSEGLRREPTGSKKSPVGAAEAFLGKAQALPFRNIP